MKKIIFIFIALLIVPLINADTCPSDNEFDFSIIPCDAISPVITENCTDFNATVIFLNDTSVNSTFNMTNLINDIYNFSFNYSTEGSYQITLCDNSTATVKVGEFLEFYSRQTYIYIFSSLFGLVFLISGFYFEKEYLVFFGGLLFLVIGLFVWNNGITEVDSILLRRVIFAISTGLGGYFMTTAYLGGEKSGSSI